MFFDSANMQTHFCNNCCGLISGSYKTTNGSFYTICIICLSAVLLLSAVVASHTCTILTQMSKYKITQRTLSTQRIQPLRTLYFPLRDVYLLNCERDDEVCDAPIFIGITLRLTRNDDSSTAAGNITSFK